MGPVNRAGRRWGMKDIAVLWISMSACIPTYMLASGLINGGMNWWQAVLTIFLGNVIVLVPMVLNAHAGTKYGIPFPVYCRASFGIRGANIPALLRALVACGWFGIQTWIGGGAIYRIFTAFIPVLGTVAEILRRSRRGRFRREHGPIGLLSGVLAGEHVGHLHGNRIDSHFAQRQSAAAYHSWDWRCWRGPISKPADLARCFRNLRSSHRANRKRESFGASL